MEKTPALLRRAVAKNSVTGTTQRESCDGARGSREWRCGRCGVRQTVDSRRAANGSTASMPRMLHHSDARYVYTALRCQPRIEVTERGSAVFKQAAERRYVIAGVVAGCGARAVLSVAQTSGVYASLQSACVQCSVTKVTARRSRKNVDEVQLVAYVRTAVAGCVCRTR